MPSTETDLSPHRPTEAPTRFVCWASTTAARVFGARCTVRAQHATVGQSAGAVTEAPAVAAYLLRPRIAAVAVGAHRPLRRVDPCAGRDLRAADAGERLVAASAPPADPAGRSLLGQGDSSFALGAAWWCHRRVALGEEHMSQPHDRSWTTTPSVREHHWGRGEILVDAVERLGSVDARTARTRLASAWLRSGTSCMTRAQTRSHALGLKFAEPFTRCGRVAAPWYAALSEPRPASHRRISSPTG